MGVRMLVLGPEEDARGRTLIFPMLRFVPGHQNTDVELREYPIGRN